MSRHLLVRRTRFPADSGRFGSTHFVVSVVGVGLALVCLAGPVRAQIVGVLGGVNSTGIQGDRPVDTSYGRAKRLQIGAFAEWRLTNEIWLHTELAYSQRGTRIGEKIEGQRAPDYNSRLALDYVSMPILLKVASRSGRIYTLSGVDLAFLVDATLKQDGAPDVDLQSQLLSTDVAVNFAVGGMVRRSNPAAGVEVRYTQSLYNLGENIQETSIPVRFRSSGFHFLVNLTWQLGRRP
jgi:hypothetical protein